MTEAQSNSLRAARRIAAARLDLLTPYGALVPFSEVPYAKQEAYTTELARIIASSPQHFDAQTVKIANDELTDKPNEPLSTDAASDRAAVFLGELATQAEAVGAAAAGIGEGVKTTLSAAAWVIPVAGVVLVGIYLYGQYLRAKRA